MLVLGIFSFHDYLSGKIVMLSPSHCLNFKMFLKALLIWGVIKDKSLHFFVHIIYPSPLCYVSYD